MFRLSPVIAVLLIVVSAVAASAQSAAPPAGSTQTLPGQAAPDTDIMRKGGTLSDKLDASGGVIRPEGDVDPGIDRVPRPATGTMPVVPPPGSPGGAPDIVPK